MRNYNDMTKEEKIKEAWGLNYDEFSEHIDSDGWARYPNFQKHEMVQDVRPIEFRSQGTDFRPKSLQGIENNNGWIKIESDGMLPSDNGLEDYYVFKFSNQYKFIRRTYKRNEVIDLYNQGEITHYRSIEKPKQPLY